MPALYLFKKRTLLGGDDLQLPALLTICTRVVQVLCFALPLATWLVHDGGDYDDSVLVYLLTDPSHDALCTGSHYFPLLTSVHLLSTILFGLFSIALEYRIWHCSCQGTPTIREPRSTKMQTLLEWKFSVMTAFLVCIALTYIAAAVFVKTYLECHRQDEEEGQNNMWIGSHFWWFLSILMILSQALEILMLSVFLLRLFLQRNEGGRQSHHYHHEMSEELWTDRCHWMCKCLSVATCCLFGGQDLMENHNPAVAANNIYQQVAIALAEYLETGGTLDVVPTDLITGLLVLQKLQEQRKLKAQIQVIRSSQQQRQFVASSTVDQGTAIDGQGMANNKSSNNVIRRVRSSLNQQSKSTTSAFSPRGSSSGSLSPAGSSSSSLVGLETSQLENASALEDQWQQNIYRRVDGLDSLRYESRVRQVLDPHNPVDQENLQDGARMAKFALAIYTWMLYVFVHPITGMPRICCRSCQVCCRQGKTYQRRRPQQESALLLDNDEELDDTVGDNICQWHKHALLLVAELESSDLIYAQFENRFSLMPYCILLDHESQAVIISIRGSLSLEDMVTDAMIDPESCQELGEEFGFDATNQYCHAGVVACVQNVYQDLQRHRLLESLEEDFPNYQLRLVGHSLGAASATLLSYMLKPRYNNLKVYNFSPPGCSMTWELATQCHEWTTTFVLDSDIVPRLSVLALEDLRDEVLQLVGCLKVPKYQVFESLFPRGGQAGFCCGGSSGSQEPDLEQNLVDLNQHISDILDDSNPSDTLYHRQLQEFLQVQEELKQSRDSSRTLRLYPPGRMIHLLKTGEDDGCTHAVRKCITCCMSNSGFSYTPIYIANDDLNEIVVSPTMGTDHFVDRMYDELGNIAREFEMKNHQQDQEQGLHVGRLTV
jgi:sn1-specific diacylglycerol lipase